MATRKPFDIARSSGRGLTSRKALDALATVVFDELETLTDAELSRFVKFCATVDTQRIWWVSSRMARSFGALAAEVQSDRRLDRKRERKAGKR